MGRPKEDPETRFWRYVEKTDRCWEWIGGFYKDGYGQFWDGENRSRAHRFAYETFVGPINGLQVLHACDNPSCVNPEHLFLGTNADNVADMVQKGRQAATSGEQNGAAKLTSVRVRTARYAHFKYSIPQRQIAERYGVTPSATSLAIRGINWSEV